MLAIMKKTRKMNCWNEVGMMQRLILIHTLIKPDLQGFSHLLECAPQAVKLSPALSGHMSSPQMDFSVLLMDGLFHYWRVRPLGSVWSFSKVQDFLSVGFDKCSLRDLGQKTSVGDAMGQHSLKFCAGAASHRGFLSSVTSRWCNIPCSPEWINRDFQYLLVGIIYWILECLLCWCNTWIPCSHPVLGTLCWHS